MRASICAAALLTVAVPSIAHALPPECGQLVIDDALAGSTVGEQQGGELGPDGFIATGGGSIVWDFDSAIRNGCVEITLTGLHTVGVAEHDFLELFTGPGGAFSDGNTDHFLLYKIAGDVFPDYEGRVKVEMGQENSATEVGSWSDNLAWNAKDSHVLAVKFQDGVATFYRDDVELEVVDYNSINGGAFDFESLRIPNDGNYQSKPALYGLTVTSVAVYDADPPDAGDSSGGGETGGDTGADDTDGATTAADDTDGATDAEPPGDDTASDADSGSDDDAGAGDSSAGLGLPPSNEGPEDSGCGCRAVPAPSVAPLVGLLLLLLRRRRA